MYSKLSFIISTIQSKYIFNSNNALSGSSFSVIDVNQIISKIIKTYNHSYILFWLIDVSFSLSNVSIKKSGLFSNNEIKQLEL